MDLARVFLAKVRMPKSGVYTRNRKVTSEMGMLRQSRSLTSFAFQWTELSFVCAVVVPLVC
jgi:hypothetical protein